MAFGAVALTGPVPVAVKVIVEPIVEVAGFPFTTTVGVASATVVVGELVTADTLL